MQYVLKKDLPYANAGTEIEVEVNLSTSGITVFADPKIKCNSIHTLLEDGWIEEIKPREVLVGEFKDNKHRYIINDCEISVQPDNVEVFKAREVIDEKD